MVQQIGELQEAARRNAESIKILAEEMKEVIQAMEDAAVANDRMLKLYRLVSIVSLVVAVLSFVLCVIIISKR